MAYVSNTLIHWVGSKLSSDEERLNILLEEILLKKRLLYSFNYIPFRSRYGGISKKGWGVEMVCFTDIPYSQSAIHCSKYSKYGVAFSKPDLAANLVVPVWYTMSPFIYASYSYMYNSISGLKSVIDGSTISEGKLKGQIFTVHHYLQQLHNLIALFQDYSELEFNPAYPNKLADTELSKVINDENAYYFEREWRSIYRTGDRLQWNESENGRNYFSFEMESVKMIIVPSDDVKKVKIRLSEIFSPDMTPIVMAYEDLQHL